MKKPNSNDYDKATSLVSASSTPLTIDEFRKQVDIIAADIATMRRANKRRKKEDRERKTKALREEVKTWRARALKAEGCVSRRVQEVHSYRNKWLHEMARGYPESLERVSSASLRQDIKDIHNSMTAEPSEERGAEVPKVKQSRKELKARAKAAEKLAAALEEEVQEHKARANRLDTEVTKLLDRLNTKADADDHLLCGLRRSLMALERRALSAERQRDRLRRLMIGATGAFRDFEAENFPIEEELEGREQEQGGEGEDPEGD